MPRAVNDLVLSGSDWQEVLNLDGGPANADGGPALETVFGVNADSSGGAIFRGTPTHREASGMPDAGVPLGVGERDRFASQRGSAISKIEAKRASSGIQATVFAAVTAS